MQVRSLIPLALGGALLAGCEGTPSQGGAGAQGNANFRFNAGGPRFSLNDPGTPPRYTFGRPGQQMPQRPAPDPAVVAEASGGGRRRRKRRG